MQTEDDFFNDPEFQELLEEYEQAVESGQPVFMDADDLVDIADYYQSVDRPEDAEAAIDKALELSPDSALALIYKAHDVLDEEQPDKAQYYLDKVIDKNLPEYVYCQGEVYLQKDQVEEADQYFRDCFADVEPDEYQDYVLDVANIYIDYGLNEKAMEWMMRAKHEDTDDFLELMARTLFGLGKFKDSERIFNELIDKHPFQKRYWNGLASVQFMNEDYDASITSSEYAIAIDPEDPEGLFAKANGLYRLGNYEEALKYYERYLKREPDDEYGYLHQGSCLINLDRYEEAIECLKKGLELSSDDSPYLCDIYQEMSFAYSAIGKVDDALSYIEKTESLDCDHIDMQVVKGHILLANDRQREALRVFRKAVSDSGYAPHTLLRIVISLLDNHYLTVAYNAFKLLFKAVDEDYDEGYSYMALCCWELNKTDEFMQYLQLACEKNPQETQAVLSHLFPEGMKVDDYYSYMQKRLTS